MKRILLLLAFWALASVVVAEEEPPQPPRPVNEKGEAIEPEVTIREEEGKTIHEYRINGQIYMLKIVPRHGKPYYLMDLDGDGQFDEVSGDDPGRIVLPQWILFRW